jgi:hypothetical protein
MEHRPWHSSGLYSLTTLSSRGAALERSVVSNEKYSEEQLRGKINHFCGRALSTLPHCCWQQPDMSLFAIDSRSGID